MTAHTRLQKEFAGIQKEKIPYIYTIPDPSDWLTWHFVIYGLSAPYKDGVYYGLLEFPSSYPRSAPSMKLITPNGRFESYQNICTTNSNFHPETWTPAWNVRTILIGLVSHMLGNDGGIGTMRSSNNEKIKFAKESMNWNLNCYKFVAVFQESLKEFYNEEVQVQVKQNKISQLKEYLMDARGFLAITGLSLIAIVLINRVHK